MLETVVVWCNEHNMKDYGLLYLASYAFLLRLPSEALPMQAGRGSVKGVLDSGQSVLTRTEKGLTLSLRRRRVQLFVVCAANVLLILATCRKNAPAGSTLMRTCWCAESTVCLRDSVPHVHAP